MLNPNEFSSRSLLLGNRISTLWMLVYLALIEGVTPDKMKVIQRVMREVNLLHREMFPDFEHALYSDDLISMVEGDEAE